MEIIKIKKFIALYNLYVFERLTHYYLCLKDGYGENIYDQLNEGLYIVVWDYRVYIITSEIRFMLWYGMKIYLIYIFSMKIRILMIWESIECIFLNNFEGEEIEI